MPRTVYLTLPVTDLARSRSFYAALGFALNPAFSDDASASFQASEALVLMLATHDRFQAISPKPLILPTTGAMSLIALSCDSRAEVDDLATAALANGGRELHEAEDLGFMYSRAFEDPDGNGFGPFWMEQPAAP